MAQRSPCRFYYHNDIRTAFERIDTMKLQAQSSFTITIALIIMILVIIAACLKGAEPAKTLNLKLDWKGPAGWQTNGAVFNIRWYSNSWIGDYNTWPIIRSVTNSVTTTLTNVSPTQLYAITLRCSNGDTSSFVGPVTAQY